MGRKWILIVDDEIDIRELLCEVFQDAGYQVLSASNGQEALTILPALERPCVVLLDLIMPVMSGGELYAAMQADGRFADIPVVISTSDPSRAPEGLPVIRKPINLPRLLSTIFQLC